MATTSPWNKIKPVTETISLQEIMSEEIARDLQNKEEQKLAEFLAEQHVTTSENDDCLSAELLNKIDDQYCDSDAVIAKMLQCQYDREYDAILKKTEDKFNGSSKVSISFSNYRRHSEYEDEDYSDDEPPENPEDKKDWDRFETVEKEFNAIPRCGYKLSEGNMITKHDITMSGRRNACKVMAFPPEFHTGDGAGFDMRLSNKVFNSLKAYSRTEQARRHRFHDRKEDHATAEMGVDENTRLLLYKLVNNQLLQQVNGVISTGKESVVLHADSDPTYTERELPKECAIKIFKTTLNEFKSRDKYIKDDYRFKDRFSKQNPRKVIHLWAEKEMHNLMRIKKIGLPCPEVICLKKHILVMSFIGDNNRPAPKLKDAILKSDELDEAYQQAIDAVTKLYREAQLVHADFSEYNILWHDNKCWFIDVSQAVEHAHPSAFEFLLRDCGNISSFFTRKGVSNVKTAEEIFIHVTGIDSKTAIDSQRKGKKGKPHLVDHPHHEQSYNFEYLWNESKIDTTTANIATEITDLENVHLVEPPPA